jgi:hypothetical protein
VILKRTIPMLIPSVVIRFDEITLKEKEVFNINFTKGIKPPWVIGFSFDKVQPSEIIEQAAYQCAGVE